MEYEHGPFARMTRMEKCTSFSAPARAHTLSLSLSLPRSDFGSSGAFVRLCRSVTARRPSSLASMSEERTLVQGAVATGASGRKLRKVGTNEAVNRL